MHAKDLGAIFIWQTFYVLDYLAVVFMRRYIVNSTWGVFVFVHSGN